MTRALLLALWLLVVVIAAQAAGGAQSAKEANDATLTDGSGMGGRGSPALATSSVSPPAVGQGDGGPPGCAGGSVLPAVDGTGSAAPSMAGPLSVAIPLACPTEAPSLGNRAGPSVASPTVRPTPPPLAAHVVLRGTAAWCAPTATRCKGWGGHVLLGAVRSFRWGDRPYRVRVVSGSRSVVVTVVSFCACGGDRVIDLSPYAFSKLAPLSAGLVRVRVLR
jgi:hypothetical protein